MNSICVIVKKKILLCNGPFSVFYSNPLGLWTFYNSLDIKFFYYPMTFSKSSQIYCYEWFQQHSQQCRVELFSQNLALHDSFLSLGFCTNLLPLEMLWHSLLSIRFSWPQFSWPPILFIYLFIFLIGICIAISIQFRHYF